MWFSLQGLGNGLEEGEKGVGLEWQSGVPTAGGREVSCGEISGVLSSHFICSGGASQGAWLAPVFRSSADLETLSHLLQ